MHKEDLAGNFLQWLIYYKSQSNQIKLNQTHIELWNITPLKIIYDMNKE